MKYLALLYFLLRGVIAVKLPGRNCPEVPQTHRNDCIGYLNIMYSIPYTGDQATYLFREMNRTDVQLERFSITPYSGRELQALHLTDSHTKDRIVKASVVSSDGWSFLLQSDLFKNVMFAYRVPLCPEPIIENVRVWCEYPFLFIWSCVEGESEETEHEEALLIVESYYKKGRKQAEVLAVAKNFISEDLLALIDLEKHIELQDGYADGLFRCPHIKGQYKWAPFAMLVIVLSLIVLIGFNCHEYYFKGEEVDSN